MSPVWRRGVPRGPPTRDIFNRLHADVPPREPPGAPGFQEGLDASFGANTGAATNNGGSFTNLAAGANSTALAVGVDTSTAGAKAGTATVLLTSNGTVSGLSNLTLTSQVVGVSGNVYEAAVGQLNTATPFNFGTVQVGQSVSQALSISNTGTGPAGFVEDLNASFGTATGTGASLISGTASISGLLAGATNTTCMTVSVNTSSVATVNGSSRRRGHLSLRVPDGCVENRAAPLEQGTMTADFRDNRHERRGRVKQIGRVNRSAICSRLVNADRR